MVENQILLFDALNPAPLSQRDGELWRLSSFSVLYPYIQNWPGGSDSLYGYKLQ